MLRIMKFIFISKLSLEVQRGYNSKAGDGHRLLLTNYKPNYLEETQIYTCRLKLQVLQNKKLF